MGLSIAVIRGAFLAVVLAGTALCAVCPAVAQTQDIGKRVNKLEKEMGAVQRKVFGRGYVPPAADETVSEVPAANPLADMEVRVNSLESRLQQLTGQVEELRHRNEVLSQRLEGFMADAEFRFNSLDGKGGMTSSSGGAAATTGGAAAMESAGASPAESAAASAATTTEAADTAPADVLPDGAPIEQYNHAYALLSKGKYAEAEVAFKAFLTRHPQDELAGNASYWLGQSYFVRGQYDQAAKVFLEGYQAYPKSSKGPDFLLKIGVSLTKIDQKQDACAVFNELKSRFPNSPAAKERMPAERKAAGCK